MQLINYDTLRSTTHITDAALSAVDTILFKVCVQCVYPILLVKVLGL